VFGSIEAFANWFAHSENMAEVSNELGQTSFEELVTHSRAQGPDLTDWGNKAHEIQLGKQLIAGWAGGEEVTLLLARSLKLLAMLVARDDLSQLPYSGLTISKEWLRDYPINLTSFRDRCIDWQKMSLEKVMSELMLWSMDTHLRVALRKLRQSSRSTFQLRPSERGLEVVCDQVPPPSQTTPRFRQAVRILHDLGLLMRDDEGKTRLTDSGRSLMEVTSV
jgi:hypothetical protein